MTLIHTSVTTLTSRHALERKKYHYGDKRLRGGLFMKQLKKMSETRILVRLLWMYFPRNWEFGSVLSKLRHFGGEGGLNPPPNPSSRYATGTTNQHPFTHRVSFVYLRQCKSYNLSCKVTFLYTSWMAEMNTEFPYSFVSKPVYLRQKH